MILPVNRLVKEKLILFRRYCLEAVSRWNFVISACFFGNVFHRLLSEDKSNDKLEELGQCAPPRRHV